MTFEQFCRKHCDKPKSFLKNEWKVLERKRKEMLAEIKREL